MSYLVKVTTDALEDIEKLKKSGDKASLKKLNNLLDELRDHPETGSGKPEKLKDNYSGRWSRKISEKHRLIYEIHEEVVTVIVLSTFGHYGDK
jgi:toxin YoeB